MPRTSQRPLGPVSCSRPTQTTELEDTIAQFRTLQRTTNENFREMRATMLSTAEERRELVSWVDRELKLCLERHEAQMKEMEVQKELLQKAKSSSTLMGFIIGMLIVIILLLQHQETRGY